MRYEQRMRKYWQKKLEDPLPKLPEDERIYLNVPYMARDFAKYSHCGFDPERKLWFTGSLNRNLYDLVELYGIKPPYLAVEICPQGQIQPLGA